MRKCFLFLVLPCIGFSATLLPTFLLRKIEREWIPFQNKIPYPSFEWQLGRKRVFLHGEWKKARLEDADHSLTLSQRDEEVISQLRAEVNKIPPSAWKTCKIPGVENPYPDDFQGVVWYTKEFSFRKEAGRALLYFLSANYVADVWLNGSYLGYHEGGYTPFCFDITPYLRERNRLEVRVDNIPWGTRKDIFPCNVSDWWNYGGIIGDVYIESVPSLYIARVDVKPLDLKGNLKVIVVLRNASSQAVSSQLEITCFPQRQGIPLRDPAPQKIADVTREIKLEGQTRKEFRLKPEEVKPFSFLVRVPNPKLWDLRSPNLYVLRAKLVASPKSKTEMGDEFWVQFGIRTLSTERDKLLLNGKPVFLPGVFRHEDSPTGRTMSREAIWRDLTFIKEMNANFVRAHYPHHPYTLLAADRLGLLYWQEIGVYWMGDEEIRAIRERGIARQVFLEMLFRDFNRPSVGFWGICNECGGTNERGALIRELRDLAREVDGTRLLGQATFGTWFNDPTQKDLDVAGFNCYWEVFYGKDAEKDTMEGLEKMHEALPDKPIIVTEFGYWSFPDWRTVEKQVSIARKTFKALRSKPYVAGCIWFCMFDYWSMALKGKEKLETFGTITLDRKRKRPVYDVLKELYKEAP